MIKQKMMLWMALRTSNFLFRCISSFEKQHIEFKMNRSSPCRGLRSFELKKMEPIAGLGLRTFELPYIRILS